MEFLLWRVTVSQSEHFYKRMITFKHLSWQTFRYKDLFFRISRNSGFFFFFFWKSACKSLTYVQALCSQPCSLPAISVGLCNSCSAAQWDTAAWGTHSTAVPCMPAPRSRPLCHRGEGAAGRPRLQRGTAAQWPGRGSSVPRPGPHAGSRAREAQGLHTSPSVWEAASPASS